MEHRMKYVISADFGQTTDYTAVSVIRRRGVPVGDKYVYEGDHWSPEEVRQKVRQEYDLIRLDRVQLHTPYTKIAKGIVKLLQEVAALHRREDDLRPRQPVEVGLAIDEGGVGKAVKDILVEAVEDGIRYGEPHITFLPVTATGGINTTKSCGMIHAPKRDLIHSGIVVYQTGRLRVGNIRHRATLERELTEYRIRQNLSTGHDTYGPFREREHDDLLFSVCLGLWAWERALKRLEYIAFPQSELFAMTEGIH